MPNTIRPKYVKHDFSRFPTANIRRSRFDRSHGYKTTLDGGKLIPVFVDEALPGDNWKLDATQLCRMTTPLVPFMDNLRISYFFFSVPKRLVWEHFEDFITGSTKGKLGTTHTAYPTITIDQDVWESNELPDYLGIPQPSDVSGEGKHVLNALPFRACNLIYNEWFRDENLCDELPVNLSDESEVYSKANYPVCRRGKRHDYFTSALPWVQKGPDVTISVGQAATVYGNGSALMLSGLDTSSNSVLSALTGRTESDRLAQLRGVAVQDEGDGANPPVVGSSAFLSSPIKGGTFVSVATKQALIDNGYDEGNTGLYADLSDATGVTINSLREAFAVQHLLERDAYGSRYVESLLSHFGVRSPDFRLQRPEYLGGGTIDFEVNSIAQTSGTDNKSTPQGNLAANARAVGRAGFRASFVEHSIVIGFACVTTDLTYQQGIDRMFYRSVRTDEYWPEFAHLGEQPVYEREIFATGIPDNDNAIFGYQERYAEYRYKPSKITGLLRSDVPSTLDYWHLSQQFESAPSLSRDFIEEHPPFERVLAVQNEPQFILDCWFDFKCDRPLPLFANPAVLGRF